MYLVCGMHRQHLYRIVCTFAIESRPLNFKPHLPSAIFAAMLLNKRWIGNFLVYPLALQSLAKYKLWCNILFFLLMCAYLTTEHCRCPTIPHWCSLQYGIICCVWLLGLCSTTIFPVLWFYSKLARCMLMYKSLSCFPPSLLSLSLPSIPYPPAT